MILINTQSNKALHIFEIFKNEKHIQRLDMDTDLLIQFWFTKSNNNFDLFLNDSAVSTNFFYVKQVSNTGSLEFKGFISLGKS